MKYIHDWILPDDLKEMMVEHGLESLPVGSELTYNGERFLVVNFHGGLKYTLAEWSEECKFYARRIAPTAPPLPPPVRVTTVADMMDLSLRHNLEELLSRVLHLNPDCPEIGLGMLAHIQSLSAMIATQLQGAACSEDSSSDCAS